MSEFKVGDWVTVGNGLFFTPGKKYQVFDGDYRLFLIDEEGDERWVVLGAPSVFKIEKTTSPEATNSELIAHLKNHHGDMVSASYILEHFFGITATTKTVTVWSDDV